MTSPSTPEHRIGSRLSFSGSVCTVQYIGPVKGTEGTWLGVEWDDPLRGKHSGEHGGERYFEVRVPKSASFIRPSRKADPILDFPTAVRQKYAPTTPETSAPVTFGTKIAEEVGFKKILDKMSDIASLDKIMVDAMGINSAGPEGAVAELCPQVKDLGLAGNLFERLEEVGKICIQMKDLDTLRLDANRMSDFRLSDSVKDAFRNVKWLELKAMMVTPAELTQLLSHFPSLENIDMSHNRLTHLNPLPHKWNLSAVDLTNNLIPSITAISPLSPGPTSLTLKQNLISTLEALDEPFTNTTDLSLTFNRLPHAATLDLLPISFPNLTSLRITHNPLFPSPPEISTPQSEAEFRRERDTAQALIVARLPPTITMLNFSKITDDERMQAELYYLGLIAKEIAAAGEGKKDEIVARHRRWAELCESHGEPDLPLASSQNQHTLAANLIKLVIRDEVRDRDETMEVPKAMSVGRLLWLVGRRWGVGVQEVKLKVEERGREERVLGLVDTTREVGGVFIGQEKISLVAV